MDIVKMVAAGAQSVAPATPTQLTLSTTLISAGGSSLAPAANSISFVLAGYYLVTIEVQVIGTGQHKLHLRRNSGFLGPSTETLEMSGTASGISHGRTLILRVSANSFLFLVAEHDGGANRDYTVSLCAARLGT